MKKFLFSLITIVSCSFIKGFSQTNALPQSGNVGIGTTTPISPLHLMGNMTLQGLSTSNYIPSLFFKRYSDGTPIFSLGYKNPSTPNSFIDFNSQNGNPISFSMVNVERMSILENGNVGIGTTSPISSLSIHSQAISGNKVVLNINNPASYGVGLGTSTAVLRFNRSPNDAGTTGVMADILGGNESETTSSYGYLGFATRNGATETTTERMRLTSSGNLGIGTTNPLAKLEVAGGTVKFSNNWFPYFDGNNYHRANNHIFADIEGNEKMWIAGTGNVGIGTTNPTEKLSIYGVNNSAPGVLSFESSREDVINTEVGVLKAKNSNIEIARVGLNRAGGNHTGFLNFWVKKTNETSLFEAMRISENGNVGIGTSDKTYQTFNINGGIGFANFNNADKKLYSPSDGDLEWMTHNLAGVHGFAVSHQGTKMVYLNTYGNSYLNGGNVGIGTATPSVKLDVVGGKQRIYNALGTNDYTNIGQHSGQFRINNGLGTLESKTLEFALLDNGTGIIQANESGVGYNNLALNPVNGNVGIGTTTPTAKLEIASTIGSGLKLSGLSQTNVQQGVTRNLGINDAGEVMVTNNNSTNQLAPSNVSLTSLEKNVLFYAHKRFKFTQTGSAKLDETLLFDGSFEPSYTNTAPTETDPTVILLEDLPQYHVQRGVWIGWSTRYWPSTKFKIEVFDTWNYSGNANYNKWVTIAEESNYSGYDYKVFLPTSSIYPVISKIRFTFYNGSSETGRLGVSELFYLSPEASKAYDGFLAKLSPDGNLGVGTTTPRTKTEIASTLSPPDPLNSEVKKGNLILTDGGNIGLVMGVMSEAGGQYPAYLQARNNTGSSLAYNLLLNPLGGNVGIGTTNPTRKFEVISPSKDIAYFRDNSTASEVIFKGSLTNTVFDFGNRPLQVQFNSEPSFTLNTSGDMGIGVTSPAQKLHVNGNSMLSTTNPSQIYDWSGIAAFTTGIYGSTTNNARFSINTNSAGEAFSVNYLNGSVGIGTTTVPTNYKLAVAGDMIAERVVVKLIGNWPDYVFSPNYKRSTLSEVEEYINKNHHLPNIPSAQEVAESGIDVGKMNAKLLEKMEEMTLYMIEQQKEIKALREEVKQIKDKK